MGHHWLEEGTLLFKAYYILKHDGVLSWGRWSVVGVGMVVLNNEHLNQYPNLKH